MTKPKTWPGAVEDPRCRAFVLRKTEHKSKCLAEYTRASWMKSEGWTDDQIAAHYQADRDARARGKWRVRIRNR